MQTRTPLRFNKYFKLAPSDEFVIYTFAGAPPKRMSMGWCYGRPIASSYLSSPLLPFLLVNFIFPQAR